MTSYTVAIQDDSYGENDASSPIWTRLLQEAGHAVRKVNVYRADILEQLEGCDGFMWRHGHNSSMRQIARRLLPILENTLGLTVYPDQNTCWHYDDKIAQAYLFSALGIPTPKTWIWFDAAQAKEWLQTAAFPLVLKLWAGAGSTNVRLVHSMQDASRWIDRFFSQGAASLAHPPPLTLSRVHARLKEAFRYLRTGFPPSFCPSGDSWELHKNYVLFQEFLPGNAYDTRITVIGDRAWGFRRFNREGDFRASGSGKIDHDPGGIAPEFIRLGFETARKIGAQSCASDGLWRGKEAVLGEVSYTYASWAVHACSGYWDSNMNWHEGQMWPEEAQIEDFILALTERNKPPQKNLWVTNGQMSWYKTESK